MLDLLCVFCCWWYFCFILVLRWVVKDCQQLTAFRLGELERKVTTRCGRRMLVIVFKTKFSEFLPLQQPLFL